MLVHLAIRNLAVIEDAALDLGPGLNVVTGETGAGKSIVIGALELVLGGRARSDLVRSGATRAEVQALFRVPEDSDVGRRLVELDLVDEEPRAGHLEVLVRRLLPAGGRGRVYVNGALTTVGTLAALTRGLVEISSQHEHTALVDPAGHLDLLDRYGGLGEVRDRYDTAWGALVVARSRRDALKAREKERLQREDYVRFQLEEIATVDPQPGEEDDLSKERERLIHAERLSSGAREVEGALAGRTGSACDVLLGAIRTMERLAAVDETLTPLTERLEGARLELEDVAFDARRYGDGIDGDPRRLADVEDRLDALRRLRRKHGLDLEAVLERAAGFREELEGFECLEVEIHEADAAVTVQEAEALEAAETLTSARAVAASELATVVDAELASLAMNGACVAFELARREALGARGIDEGELTIRTNPGEPFKPLARVASGGELSRLLLALKRALVRVDPALVSVFDEVDTGVGGAVAEVVGLKLSEIAKERQVLAITHLPQIAAQAHHHVRVSKDVVDERAVTVAEVLDPAARAEEIARMLGGVEITQRTREHAQELLERGGPTTH